MQKIYKEKTLLKPIFLLLLQVVILTNIFYLLSSSDFIVDQNEVQLLLSVVAIGVLGLMTIKSLVGLKEQETLSRSTF